MSQLEEFSSTVDHGCQQIEEVTATCEGAMTQAEAIASAYVSLGAETPASQAESMRSRIEAAVSQLAAARSQLEEAQSIAMALSSGLLATKGVTPPTSTGRSATPNSSPGLWTQPSLAPSPDRSPRGEPSELSGASAKNRAITRENETAKTLAMAGYDIQQNPPPNEHGKEPDYVIEGEYWDCYAPTSHTEVKGIHGTLEKKARKKRQAERIVINCDDNDVSPVQLQERLQRLPIKRLKEVKIVKNGTIIDVYPVERK
ncbi:hypothetical protein [Natronoglycomyces albus]|uniref:tRNA nuclease CdiA C-terminal domain-containing protein n=1 Tax=Natronoglycomyces albus TaxID=2811108 RepID=A0A895XL26_9ACTN|nr:hypothetical protein [Natronoglycomyces albus]QSB06034.1 hypothetical protein JQS30_03675 [Natronoglycomyces albus]